MARYLRSSAFRLALGYIAVSIAVLGLFAAPLWYAWRQNVQEVRTELLREDAQSLADIFQNQGPGVLAAVIDARVKSQQVANSLILFSDPSRSRLAGNLDAWPQQAPDSPGVHRVTIAEGDRSIRALLMRTTLPGGYTLLVGRDNARFRPLEALFLYGLAGAAGVLLVAGVASGLLIRRALLSEIHSIRQTTCAIVAGDFSRRLPAPSGSDELALLTHTVNRMLDQIEQLVHGVRNVSNAIAHDLRTPLAELRSRLEELLVARPDAERTFAEIEAAVADVDRVIAIFNALLRLAEIDTGARRSGFVPVNVDQVANDVVEFYQPVAELKGVNIAFESSGVPMVAGDPLLLTQAIANLVDNALKYGPKAGTIAITTQPGDGSVEVAVLDRGPGIPDGEKAKVTERFYRGDASRGTPGVGLGLSLVAAVARLHGGKLVLSDNHPGLQARVILMHAAGANPSRVQTAPAAVQAALPPAASEAIGALRAVLMRRIAAWRQLSSARSAAPPRTS
jgi:signal transduction histidine kinase